MKIAFVSMPKISPINTVLTPVVEGLRERGHTVDIFRAGENTFLDIDDEDYDLLHVGYWQYLPLFHADNPNADFSFDPARITMQLFHIEADKAMHVLGLIKKFRPARLVVSDRFWWQWFGWAAEIPASCFPPVFDRTPFKPLPLPRTFRLGICGQDTFYKRWGVARAGAAQANLPLVEHIHDPLALGRTWTESMEEFYAKISALVVTTFTDTGPLPPQEAMLCGRPVISTPTGIMPDLIIPGVNGEFYDGTPEGLAEAAARVAAQPGLYSAGALATHHPTPAEVVPMWEAMFERVLTRARRA